MSKTLWLQTIRIAWISYLRKVGRHMKPQKLDRYLGQTIDLGMTLEEFAENIFIAGFTAGEEYSRYSREGQLGNTAKLN